MHQISEANPVVHTMVRWSWQQYYAFFDRVENMVEMWSPHSEYYAKIEIPYPHLKMRR